MTPSAIASLPLEDQLELALRLVEVGPNGVPPAFDRPRLEDAKRDTEVRRRLATDSTFVARLSSWLEAHHDALLQRTLGAIPPFDPLADYWTNFYAGPGEAIAPIAGRLPRRPTRIFDLELNFPFGVPACVLTPDSRSIHYFARRGYDLLTYKTVRDRPWNPHPFPQWAFTPRVDRPWTREGLEQPIVATLDPGARPASSMVNSFGVPSLPLEEWAADVARTRAALSAGQVLIVSVAGSGDDPDTVADRQLIDQFVGAAHCAWEAGAQILEVNLSCPNTGGKGQIICESPELSRRIVESVYRAVRGNCPIFIKVSYLDPSRLTELVIGCENFIKGVVAINTYPVRAQTRSGRDFFPGRPEAGLSGVGIRNLGLEACRNLVELRSKRNATGESDWVVVGVGGVASVADFQAYVDVGADAVQSCTGAQLNSLLAAEIRLNGLTPSSNNNDIVTASRGAAEGLQVGTVAGRLVEALASGGVSLFADDFEIPESRPGGSKRRGG